MTRAGGGIGIRLLAILFAGALSLLSADARAQDAWTRFNEQLKTRYPPNFLTIGSMTPEKNGFTIRDIVIRIPAELSAGITIPAIRIAKATVLEFDDVPRLKDGSAGHGRLAIEGIEVPLAGLVDPASLATFGADPLLFELTVDASLNASMDALKLNEFTLSSQGLARINLTAEMIGVSDRDSANPTLLQDNGQIRKIALTYTDESLLAKLLPLFVAKSKATPEVMARIVVATFDRITPSPTPAADAFLDAIASFLLDFNAPAGPIVINADPPTPITPMQMRALKGLNGNVEGLGLTAFYPGTRPRNSAQRQSVSVAPLSDLCAPGRQSFALVGDAWRAATIREATSSNRCVVAITGGSAQEIVLPPNRLTAWSADGPGVPAARCASGDAVLIEQDGVWRTATVKPGDSRPDHCAVTLAGKDPSAVVIAPLSRLRALP